MAVRAVPAHPRNLGFYGARVTELVTRRCRDHDGDERSLRTLLLEDLRRRVPFSWHVWLLTDPETEVPVSPLATVPDHLMAHLPGIVRRRFLTTLNRWDTLEVPADSLVRATGSDTSRSLLHRELLGPSGIGDVASVVFRDRFGCWGYLDLWREAAAPPFSDAELDALTEDVPAITAALRRCQASSFDEPARSPASPGPAVLFLSPDLVVLGQTPDTDAHLRALLPTEADRRPVPAGAYNVAAALLASEAGLFDHPAVARVRPVVGTWLTFRAARLDSERPPPERDIAVSIELTSPADRRSLYARSHGLSSRETELLELLADGADTRTIAGSLHVSEHTVQDHLKSVFAKTGTRNRRTLLARVTGS
jgi:DNA-binding CsgD family transcriptional regulator